jgi:heat shock protein HslJ
VWIALRILTAFPESGYDQNMTIQQIIALAIAAAAAMNCLGCANSSHPHEPAKADSIQGAEWRLTMIEGINVPADAIITMQLTSDKKLAGSTGVNRYFGTYTSDSPGFIRFSPLGMTRRAGTPEAMKLEAQFVGAMERVTEFRIEGDSLKLGDGDKSLLVWRR